MNCLDVVFWLCWVSSWLYYLGCYVEETVLYYSSMVESYRLASARLLLPWLTWIPVTDELVISGYDVCINTRQFSRNLYVMKCTIPSRLPHRSQILLTCLWQESMSVKPWVILQMQDNNSQQYYCNITDSSFYIEAKTL